MGYIEKDSAGCQREVEMLEAVAQDVFGFKLWSRPAALAVCESLRPLEKPYCTFCWFLKKRFIQAPIQGKNFVTSETVLEAYREYLENLEEMVFGKVQADIRCFEYLMDLYYDPLVAIDRADGEVSELFRYAVCRMMGHPEVAARFEEGAKRQLEQNPFYFDVFEELQEHYPLRRDQLYAGKNE